jgi:tetratricopeptide (TPR) repeat protein
MICDTIAANERNGGIVVKHPEEGLVLLTPNSQQRVSAGPSPAASYLERLQRAVRQKYSHLEFHNANRIPIAEAISKREEFWQALSDHYSPEELALLKPPDHVLPGTGDGTDKKSSPKLPALVGSLVAEAERAFAARRYEEAEKKYYRALRFDGENAAVLAGLAAAQIKQDRLADAERNLNKALAADPKDAFSLSLLGILKIRADKYDAALDALSQSARLNPQNADTFQYLGVALAGKGLREPAVSAFRRALQLAPNNVDAHHNLAVVYAGQHPPSLELARWHYQKALQAGCPKDPGLERILDANKPAVPSE